MATSPNLGFPLLELGQAQKEVTINEDLVALDVALEGFSAIDISGGAQVDLTVAQLNVGFIQLIGALINDIDVTIPDGISRRLAFRNATTGGFTVTLRTFSGVVGSPTNDLTPAAIGVLVSDTVEAYLALGGGGGGGGAFTDDAINDVIFPTVSPSRALILGPSGVTLNRLDVRDDGRVTGGSATVKIEQDDDLVLGLQIINSTFSATDGFQVAIADAGGVSVDAIGSNALDISTASGVLSLTSGGALGATTGAGGDVTVAPGSGGAVIFGPMDAADFTILLGTNLFSIESGDPGALGPIMVFYQDSASPTAADQIATLRFDGEDSTSVRTTYAEIRVNIDDPTDTSEDASIEFFVQDLGTLTKVFGIADPKVTALVDTFEINRADDGVTGPIVDIIHNSATPLADDDIAVLRFQGNDSGAALGIVAEMRVASKVVTAAIEEGRFEFLMQDGAASLTEFMNIQPASAGFQVLNIAGALVVGTTVIDNVAGSVRWTGSDFEGNTGASWISMAGGGSGSVGAITGVDGRIAVFTGASQVEGDAALTFDTVTDTLSSGKINLVGVDTGAFILGADDLQIYKTDSGGSYPFDVAGRVVFENTGTVIRDMVFALGTTGSATVRGYFPAARGFVVGRTDGTIAGILDVYQLGTSNIEMVLEREANGNAGPIFRFSQDTASPAINDVIGETQFFSTDNAAAVQIYAKIQGRIHNSVAASERGQINFVVANNGADQTVLEIRPTSATGATTPPGVKVGNGDFELTSGVALFNSDLLDVTTRDVEIRRVNAGGNLGPRLALNHDTTVAAGLESGRLDLQVQDVPFGAIRAEVATTTTNGFMIFSIRTATVDTDTVQITTDGLVPLKAWHPPLRTVAANTTLNNTDHTVLVDASAAARTITLPTAASSVDRIYVIKAIDVTGGNVTIDGNGAETIDGATTIVLSAVDDSIMIQSDGTEWFIIADHVGVNF